MYPRYDTGKDGEPIVTDEENKQEVFDRITDLLGMPRQSIGVGSSLPSEVFKEVARQAGVPYTSMPVVCEEVVEKAGHQHSQDHDSRNTPSGGGSTVTLKGLQALELALVDLLS